MSTRWYPLYQKGNPQLRVFLPNFWMKIVKPDEPVPENIVQFHCSMEMTKHDIKNYLEKIYNVPVARVNTRIALGKTRMCNKLKIIVKDDDIKIAYVALRRNHTFKYPDLFPKKDVQDEEDKGVQAMKDEFKKYVDDCKVPGEASWFR